MLLGLGVALVLHQLLRARSLVLSIVLLPMFLAPVMVGLLGRFMLDSTIGLYAAFRFNNQLGKAAVLGLAMLAFSIVLAKLFLRFFGERPAATPGRGEPR